MWLLPRMGPNVYGQGAPLNEALSTAPLITSVRSLVGMDAIVSLQIRLAIEALDQRRIIVSVRVIGNGHRNMSTSRRKLTFIHSA